MQIKRINLADSRGNALSGIELFLGPTEARIMRLLWDRPRSLKDLHNDMVIGNNGKALAYSTVHTDLSRLVEKGILRKAINGAEVIYRPIHNNEEVFINAVLTQLDIALRVNFNKRVR